MPAIKSVDETEKLYERSQKKKQNQKTNNTKNKNMGPPKRHSQQISNEMSRNNSNAKWQFILQF